MSVSPFCRAVSVCLSTALLFLLFTSGAAAQSAPAATATALTVTIQTSPAGVTVAKLVATVQSAGSAVTVGSVEFFDGTKKIGTTAIVQLTAAGYTPGTATIQKILGPGSHSLTARFHPPLSLAASVSSASQITVPGSTMNTAALYPAGTYPLPDAGASITVADVNGDGLPDIIVPFLGLKQVQIFLNDPSNPGHFTQGPNLAMPFAIPPTKVVVGDIDGDGLPDLLIADDDNEGPASDEFVGEIALFLQNPAHPGTYQTPVGVFGDGILPRDFALIDMNGDGVPDIVFAGSYMWDDDSGHGVNVALQSPTTRGTFVRASKYYISANADMSAAVADIDGDGLPDVVFNGVNYNQIEVYYSDPNNPGGFSSAGYFPEPATTISDSRLVDVDQDGHPDLIVAEAFDGIKIFRNDPANPGNFLSPTTYTVPDRAIGIALGDVNADGIPDLIVPAYSNIVATLAGDGRGSFASPLTYAVTSPPGAIFQAVAADLDGDGLDDVVTLTSFPNGQSAPTFQVNVLLHTPSGTKTLPAVELSVPASTPIGTPMTLSASVLSSFGAPTGTVTFIDGTQTIGTATLSGSGTAQLTTTTLPAGSQTITAHYSGDANFLPADSLGSYISIVGLKPSISLSANPTTAQAGTPFTFTVNVSGSGPVPTGTTRFEQNGNLPVLATATLDSNGTATATLSTLPKGQYLIEVFYPGDSTYQPGWGQTTVTVTPGASISLAASNTMTTATGPITFTATVTNLPSLAGLPVSFFDYTTLVDSTTTDANGVATWQNPGLSPGGHEITAQYLPGNSGGSATSNELVYRIPAAPTSTALSESPSNPLSGQAVILSVTVSGSSSSLIPSGTVSFTEDGSQLGSATLDGTGKASFIASAQKPGTHSITASFTGNSQFASSSNSISFTVPTPDFSLALDHSSLSLNAGQSGSVNIQLSSLSGFSGSVQLGCGGLPTAASCSFSNSSPTLGSSGGSAVLTISINGNQAYLDPNLIGSRGLPILLSLTLVPFLFRRRRPLRSCIHGFTIVSLTVLIGGCGGASSAALPPQQQTAIVQVVGTSSAGTHAVNLTITYN